MFNLTRLFFAAACAALPHFLIAAPDTVDATFAGSAGQVFDSGSYGGVASSIVQADGKVIFGSNEMLGSIDGGLNDLLLPLIRFNADGTVDSTYGADNIPDGYGTGIVYFGAGQPEVHAMALQPDGKLIAAGVMTGYSSDGSNITHGGFSIVRFNVDGTPDGTFATQGTSASLGFNYISDVEVQADGKIVVVGGFGGFTDSNTTFHARKGIARLNSDGSVDATFIVNPADFGAAASPYGFFRDVELSPDGKMYVVGEYYTNYTGHDAQVFARLNSDGSRDTTFQPVIGVAIDYFQAVDLDAAGRIMLIASTGTNSPSFMQRYFANGTVDTSFSLDASLDQVSNEQLEETTTGQYYLAIKNLGFGDKLIRINSDGSLDPNFVAQSDYPDAPGGANAGSLRCVALSPDGSVYSGAAFSSVNGVSTRKVVKFEGDYNPTSPGTIAFAASSYTVDEDVGTVTISVARSSGVNGAATVNFATSNGSATAGSDYTATSGTLSWAAGEGGVKTFTVSILSDSAVESAETVTLTLSSVSGATLGLSSGTLTINDSDSIPLIVTQPDPQVFVIPNETLTLTVAATSAASPTTYQWYKGGVLISGATSPVYSLANAQVANSGTYTVIVTNPNGTTTSNDAVVTVKTPATLAFSTAASINVIESDGTFDLTLTRTSSSVNAVSVDVTAIPDSALESDDFSAFTQTVSWADGDSADKTVTITLTNDSTSEAAERFTVELSNWSLDARGLPSVTTTVEVLVADDDELATIDSLTDSLTKSAGRSVTLEVGVTSQTALSYQWYRNGVALGGETAATLLLSPLDNADTGLYTVEVTNLAGTVTSDVINVQVTPADLLLGATFTTNHMSGYPSTMAPAPAGGIYVGGTFNSIGGEYIYSLARVNADSTLDATFPGLNTNDDVSIIRVNSSGDIIVAGEDGSVNPNALDNRLAKVSAAGVVDSTFSANVGSAFDEPILDFEIAGDGSIYAVGTFTGLIKKLSPSGVVDATFAPVFLSSGGGVDPELYDIEIVGSNLYVGGNFNNGSGVAFLAKMDLAGNFDAAFQPGLTNRAQNLNQDNSGNILFESNFNSQGWYVKRVDSSGVIDPNFIVDGFSTQRLVLADGSILMAENNSLRKFADDGTEDVNYAYMAGTGFNGLVSDLGFASDGAVWGVGGFSTFNGEPAYRIMRLQDLNDDVIFAEEPADTAANLGDSATFSAVATGSSLITGYQWYFDGVLISDGAEYSGTTTSELTVLNVDDADEGAYTVVATNAAAQTATSAAGELQVYGAPDITFDDASPLVAYVGDAVTLSAQLTGAGPINYEFFFDGGSVATGTQTGQTGTISFAIPSAALANRGSYTIEATNAEGTTDSTVLFLDVRQAPGSIAAGFVGESSFYNSGAVSRVLPQSDGGAYIAGAFNSWYFPSQTAYRSVIVRVDAAGQILTAFNPTSISASAVSGLAGFSNGDVLLAGTSISVGGASSQRLVKMDDTGSRDTVFTTNIGTGPNDAVFDVAIDGQDRIYVAGSFTSFNGVTVPGFVRLLSNGILDTSFTPALSGSVVSASRIKFGHSGEIYLNYAGSLKKISSSGVVDSGFDLGAVISDVAIDSQGRILVATSGGILRYSAAGVIDSGFSGTESASLMTYQFKGIDVDADDQPLLLTENQLARYNHDGSRDYSLTGVGFSGSYPNRDAATFRIAADGAIWVGGSFTSPKAKYVKFTGTPANVAITQQPVEAIVEPAADASFTVSAIGTGPLSYQWYKDGSPLSDDSKYAGTDTATLDIMAAAEADEGDYSVVITNTLTTVSKTSGEVALVVLGAPEILTQPLSQAILVDTALTLTVDVQAAAPYTVVWKQDGTPLSNGGAISGADTLTLMIDPLAASGAGDYTVTITNSFGFATSDVAEITTYINPGQLAAGFTAPIFNNTIKAILPLPSGKTLVGGGFTSVTDSVSTYSRTGLALVNADGTIDTGFSIAASGVEDLELTAAGKVLLAGSFTTVGGQSRPRHARLNTDLTLDATYAPTATPNNTVYAILEDVDGNIWLGGQFWNYSGTYPTAYLAKLDNTGMPVASQVQPNGVVYDLLEAQDGDIYVAGSFTSFLGSNPRLVKINRDITLDTAFNPGTSSSINAVAESATGEVYAGDFNEIVKFSSSGVEDTSFTLPWSGIYQVNTIVVQENGRILSGFDRTPYFGRQETSGVIDTTFDLGTGLNAAVNAIAVENSGGIWVAGSFTNFNGQTVGRLIKLEGDLVDIAIRQQPTTQSEDIGTSASFTVVAETFGGEPIGYQWRKDGVDLTDGGDISGATTATLTIANLDATDEGDYDVVVTNLTTTSDQTSTAAELIVLAEPEILGLSSDQNLEVNDTLSLSVNARGAGTLTYQWKLDGVSIPDATASTYEVAQAQVSHSGVYTVVVSNTLDDVTSDPITVSVVLAPAAISEGFDQVTFNSTVRTILPLADGRTLVGGDFSQITFNGSTYYIYYLALINADGSLDTTFNLSLNNTVYRVAYDSVGRVLIGGNFTTIGGVSRARFARLQSDLTVDTSFGTSTGPNGTVYDIAEAADGSVYLAGSFNSFASQPNTAYACRLDEDGLLDEDFVSVFNNAVYRVEPQADGKLIAGGSFSLTGHNFFARFNADGSVDSSFAGGTANWVFDIDQFSDGGWIVVGNTNAMRRFDANGTWLNTWSVSVNSTIRSVAVEDDDQILLGGDFTSAAGQSVNRIARLNLDGTYDSAFTVGDGANQSIYEIALEPLGAIWLGGSFTQYRGETANRITRTVGDLVDVAIVQHPSEVVIEPTNTASFTVLALSEDPITYQWLRNGAPLTDGGDISGVTTATLEIANVEDADEDVYSVTVTNSVTSATKTSTAAQLIVLGAPEILTQPEGQVLEWESTLELEVEARGIAPLSYQWYKDDVALTDDSRISGSTTPVLTIAPTAVADTADYKVIITNTAGSATSSSVAVDVFIPPAKQVPGVTLPNFNSTVYAVLPLGDGRALVGGQFSSPRPYLALVKADGTLDSTFNLSVGSTVRSLKFDRSGRILVGGDFISIGGQPYHRIARLKADLTLDTDLDMMVGVNSTVYDVVEAADGAIWVGGAFTGLSDNSASPTYLAKFDSLGQFDASYASYPNSTVYSVEALSDGSLLVGGQFSSFQTSGRNYLAKLDASGTLISSFAPSISNWVYDIEVQTDGKLLVAGRLANYLQRLNSDGSVDSGFYLGVGTKFNHYVWSVTTQLDGKIIAGGQFASFDNQSAPSLARLNSDGSFDTDFDVGSGFNSTVFKVASEPLGNLWAGGAFSLFRGVSVPRLVKLNGYEAAVGITEQPLPAFAEAGQNAVFTVTAGGTDALTYQWQKNGVDLPSETGTTLTVAVPDDSVEGDYTVVVTNATAGLSVTSRPAELVFLGIPEVLSLSEDITLFVGEDLTLQVTARGAATLGYQWNFNGGPLPTETASSLLLTDIQTSQSGSYSVTITNGVGSVTSDPIAVSVVVNGAGVDPDFRSANNGNGGANGSVNAICTLSDGSAIVGGVFTTIAGGSATRIAKIDANGELVAGWGAVFNSTVNAVRQQSDGKFLVGGSFSSVNSNASYKYIARLNSDGTLDTTYNPVLNSTVSDIELFSDDSAIVAGNFSNVNATAIIGAVKLDSSGVIDSTFKVSGTTSITEVEIDSLGRVYFGSSSNVYAKDDGVINYTFYRLWRSTVGGVLDTSYDPNPNSYIYEMHMAADDTLYLSGSFSAIGGGSRGFFARLDVNGSLDTGFADLSLNNYIYAIEEDANGNVIVGGNFTTILGSSQNRLAMVDSTGALVPTFYVGLGLNSSALDIEVDALGKVWIGGSFTTYNGISRAYFTRLNGLAPTPAVETFASWMADAGLTGPDAAFDFDYDNDGIVNGLEFLLGGDATVSNPGLLPAPVVQNGAALSTGDTEDYLTMTVAIDEALVGLNWAVEASESLPFSPGTTQAAVQVGSPVIFGGKATYTFRMPWAVSSPAGTGFMRITLED